MKKKILLFVLIIVIIVTISALFLYFKKNKNNNKFPHYKQAFFKVEGSMNVIKNTSFTVPLIFIDSKEWSEMASSENIKSIDILDSNGNKLKIDKWVINNKTKDSKYILREIDVNATINKEETFRPEKVVLTYKDNLVKKYDFGDFNIICKPDSYYQNNIAAINCDVNPIVSSDNKDDFPYSGISFFIKGLDKQLEVKTIDLGIKSFGIDSENLKYVNMKYDLNEIMNYVDNSAKKNEKWAEQFKSIKSIPKVTCEIKPFKVAPVTEENGGTNILIPFTKIQDSDMSGIKIFNIKVTVNISGEDKEIISFQPFYVIPISLDKAKLYNFLQEEGK